MLATDRPTTPHWTQTCEYAIYDDNFQGAPIGAPRGLKARMDERAIGAWRSYESSLGRWMTWEEIPKVVQDYCLRVLPGLDKESSTSSILQQAQTYQFEKRKATSG